MKGFSFELGNQILVSMMGGAILGDFFGTKGSIIGAVNVHYVQHRKT